VAVGRIRQGHADRRGVKAVAEQVLGGEALALTLTLLGHVEGRAADRGRPVAPIGDELGARRERPQRPVRPDHAVLGGGDAVLSAHRSLRLHHLAIVFVHALHEARDAQLLDARQPEEAREPGRVRQLERRLDELEAPYSHHALSLV